MPMDPLWGCPLHTSTIKFFVTVWSWSMDNSLKVSSHCSKHKSFLLGWRDGVCQGVILDLPAICISRFNHWAAQREKNHFLTTPPPYSSLPRPPKANQYFTSRLKQKKHLSILQKFPPLSLLESLGMDQFCIDVMKRHVYENLMVNRLQWAKSSMSKYV